MATTTKPGTPRGLQPPEKKPVRITVPEERKARYGDPFFPKVPFQAIFYIGAIFIVLIFLALASPAPLEDPADPLNHAAIDPRPEWYFMFLFQLLKYFPGNFIVVGTAIIPTIVVVLLLLVPFYDRNWARKINRRPVAAGSMTLGMLIVMFLTWGGFGFPTPNFNVQSQVAAPPGVTYTISPEVASIFKAHCGQCHFGQGQGGLNISTWNGIEAGGTFIPGKPVVIPGDHKNSILYQMVQPTSPWPNGSARMPLGGPYLTAAQITTIATWIDNLGKKTGTGGATTGGTTAAVSFKNDIQPLFTAHCAVCHISIQSGNQSLANYAGLMKGGALGPAVVPGNHAKSILWQKVQPTPPWPGGSRMPLGGSGGYLTDAQVAGIAAWIDQGAKNN